jgi:hypothetical protein
MKKKQAIMKYISSDLERIIEKEMLNTGSTFVRASQEVARKLQNE